MVLLGPWICVKNKDLQKWQKKQNKIKTFQKSLWKKKKKEKKTHKNPLCFYSQDMRTSSVWYCLMLVGAKSPSPDQQRLLGQEGCGHQETHEMNGPAAYLKASPCCASVKAKPCSLQHTTRLLVCPGPFSAPLMDVHGIGIGILAGNLLWSEIKQ